MPTQQLAIQWGSNQRSKHKQQQRQLCEGKKPTPTHTTNNQHRQLMRPDGIQTQASQDGWRKRDVRTVRFSEPAVADRTIPMSAHPHRAPSPSGEPTRSSCRDRRPENSPTTAPFTNAVRCATGAKSPGRKLAWVECRISCVNTKYCASRTPRADIVPTARPTPYREMGLTWFNQSRVLQTECDMAHK